MLCASLEHVLRTSAHSCAARLDLSQSALCFQRLLHNVCFWCDSLPHVCLLRTLPRAGQPVTGLLPKSALVIWRRLCSQRPASTMQMLGGSWQKLLCTSKMLSWQPSESSQICTCHLGHAWQVQQFLKTAHEILCRSPKAMSACMSNFATGRPAVHAKSFGRSMQA